MAGFGVPGIGNALIVATTNSLGISGVAYVTRLSRQVFTTLGIKRMSMALTIQATVLSHGKRKYGQKKARARTMKHTCC